MLILQKGGTFRSFVPVKTNKSAPIVLNPQAFVETPLQKPALPQLDTEALKGLEGYSVDVDHVIQGVQSAYAQLQQLDPAELLTTKGKKLMATVQKGVGHDVINRVKKSYELGKEAAANLKDNAGFDAWLTDDQGQVYVKKKDGSYGLVSRVEAVKGINNGEMAAVTGADYRKRRNDDKALLGDDLGHSLSTFTVGMPKVRESIDEYLTGLGSSNKETIRQYMGNVSFNGTLSQLVGSRYTRDKKGSNEANVAKAVDAAWSNLSQAERATLLNESALDAGQQRLDNDVAQLAKAQSLTAEQIIELQAKARLTKMLQRALKVDSVDEYKEDFDSGLYAQLFGEPAEKAKIGPFEAAFAGATGKDTYTVAGFVDKEGKLGYNANTKGGGVALTFVGARIPDFGQVNGQTIKGTLKDVPNINNLVKLSELKTIDNTPINAGAVTFAKDKQPIITELPVKTDGDVDYKLAQLIQKYTNAKETEKDDAKKAVEQHLEKYPGGKATFKRVMVIEGILPIGKGFMDDLNSNLAGQTSQYEAIQPGDPTYNNYAKDFEDLGFSGAEGIDDELYRVTMVAPITDQMASRFSDNQAIYIPKTQAEFSTQEKTTGLGSGTRQLGIDELLGDSKVVESLATNYSVTNLTQANTP